MVQDIEKLGPETKPDSFGDAKHPLYPDIGLRSTEAAQHIAPEIALLAGRRRSECRLVEDLAAGITRAVEFARHCWVHIGPGIERDARRIDKSRRSH